RFSRDWSSDVCSSDLDQLVERTPRGMQVRATTPEEILDIYEVRVTLEGAAARLAAERRTELDLLRLKSARDAMHEVEDGDDRQQIGRASCRQRGYQRV